MDAEVGPVDLGEGTAEVGEDGFGPGTELPLGDDDAEGASLDEVDPVDADVVLSQAGRWVLRQHGLPDQVAPRRRGADELDADGLADGAATAVGTDEPGRPQRPAPGDVDVHAGVVLLQPRDLDTVV